MKVASLIQSLSAEKLETYRGALSRMSRQGNRSASRALSTIHDLTAGRSVAATATAELVSLLDLDAPDRMESRCKELVAIVARERPERKSGHKVSQWKHNRERAMDELRQIARGQWVPPQDDDI